jgi:hypothetical protein
VALCGAFLTRFPFIPGPLHGPSRSRPSGLRRSVAGCALTLQVQRHHATFRTRFFTPTTSRSAEPPGRSHSIRGGGERNGGAIPFATASEGIFRVKSWSIDGDAGSGRCSLDLLQWLSGPNFTKDGRPEFENEGTAVRFAVVRDCILFVVGEDE